MVQGPERLLRSRRPVAFGCTLFFHHMFLLAAFPLHFPSAQPAFPAHHLLAAYLQRRAGPLQPRPRGVARAVSKAWAAVGCASCSPGRMLSTHGSNGLCLSL